MSRVGKQIIQIPSGVTVKSEVAAIGTSLKVTGPKGELSRQFLPIIEINVASDKVTLVPKDLTEKALWGTYAAHVKNMVSGVVSGFSKKLIIEGVGYKGNITGEKLTLNLGFSHPVVVEIPKGIKVAIDKNEISVSGYDIEAVGQFAASMRAIKPPDPYKQKGIRYADEVVIRKQGKKVVA